MIIVISARNIILLETQSSAFKTGFYCMCGWLFGGKAF